MMTLFPALYLNFSLPRHPVRQWVYREHRIHPGSRLPALCLVLSFAIFWSFSGCAPPWHEQRAERSASRILQDKTKETLGKRRETVRYPKEEAKPLEGAEEQPSTDAVPPEEGKKEGEGEIQVLSLWESLRIATRTNRDFLSRRESLSLSALSLYGTRYSFSPQVRSALSYVFSDQHNDAKTQSAGASADLSQTLPFGGSVTLSGGTSFSADSDSDAEDRVVASSNASLGVNVPLLRGAGREVSHEALIQAERNLIYEIRDFELYRQDFSINVAERYYGLVQQKQAIENQRRNMEGFDFSKRQAEALFNVGRTSELDVLRAKRNFLNSRNRLLEEEENYQLALDRFKVFLGLPMSSKIDVQMEAPKIVPVNFDLHSAMDVAFANRLDYITRREQLEDSERDVRIAKNALLPQLDLNFNYSLSSESNASFQNQRFENRSYSIGMDLEIPLDRVSERSGYYTSLIGFRRALRSFEEFQENLVLEIQNAFRELDRRRESLRIQEELIIDQEKNLKIAQIRYEQGEISNRDVVEAQESLLEARNALIQEKVNYEIARLNLLRDLGILFVDEEGVWEQ